MRDATLPFDMRPVPVDPEGMNRLSLSSLLFSTLLLSACGGDSTTGPSEALGPLWRLVSLERTGQSAISVTTPDRYTVLLDPSGQANVRADCNSCGGRYTLAGDTLTLSPMACTLVGCPDDSLDRTFLTVLGGPARLQAGNSTLTLTSGAGTLRFTR